MFRGQREQPGYTSIKPYLQSPFPMGMGVEIVNMNMQTGDFNVIVSLTHPFDDYSLTGFDVKGILITNGISYSTTDWSLTYTDHILDPTLYNADGYTRWWNQKEFTQPGILGYTEGFLGTRFTTFTNTLNPFRYFADHLDVDDEFFVEPGSRNHFGPGNTNSRRYLLNFPALFGTPLVVFNYAVDACWEAADGPPLDLDNFPPDANQTEPYYIEISDNGSTAFYNEETGLYGGDLALRLDVYDYGLTGDISTVSDEIESIVIESHTLFPNPVDLDDSFIVSAFEGGAVYNVTIENVTPTSTELQEILVHVYSPDGSYDQGYGTPAPNKPLGTFLLWNVPISPDLPYPPPPANLTADVTRDPTGILNGFTLEWDESIGAEAYLVYWSKDPYGIEGPMSFSLAENWLVDTPSWQYSVAGQDINGQWMLEVIAQGIIGNDDTNSDPSNPALVDFSAFEDFPEGQNEWRRRFNSIRNRFLAATTAAYGIQSSGSLILSPSSYFARHATAYCVSPTLPEMPDAVTCFIEFAHNRVYTMPEDYGYSVCSSPSIQDPGIIAQYLYDDEGVIPDFMVLWDYNIDLVDYSDRIYGDPMNDMDIDGMKYRWNESPDEDSDPTNGWSGTPSSGFAMSRYAVPAVIEEGHSYVGICFAGAELGLPTIPISPPQFPLICDEIALVIY